MTNATEPIRIAFAGGGTGGHLLPGISVAQEGAARAPGSHYLFIGSGRPAERALFARYPFPHRDLDIPVPRRTPAGLFRFGRRLLAVVAEAEDALADFRPRALVGLGGYASVPGVLAARRRGIQVFLLEQNARPGAANAALAPLARGVFCGFSAAARRFGSRGIHVGNPLRRDLATLLARGPERAGDQGLRLFVMGGSQGARGLNDLLVAAAPSLARVRNLRIVHLAGADAERVASVYEDVGLAGATVAPFDPDVGRHLASADLVVSRAGAMAVSEITAFARPAIFVPYPHAGDHQADNAGALVRDGGAVLVREGPGAEQRFVETLLALLASPPRLHRMGRRAARFARPQAARDVFQAIVKEVGS